MYVENGVETIVHLRCGKKELVIAVDDESYARLLNEGWELVEELSSFTRLPQDAHTGLYDPERRMPQ